MINMTTNDKFYSALTTVKGEKLAITWEGKINTEEDFNKIEWITGEDENQIAITTTINPYPEVTWTLVKNEMDRLQAEYDTQDYARNRKAEYPDIGDQLDSLYHAGVFPADMTATLQAVKDKYPKE